MTAVLSYGHMRGGPQGNRPIPPAELIERFKLYNWQATVLAFAQLAALLAQPDEGPDSPTLHAMALEHLRGEPRIARYLEAYPKYQLVNEAAVYFCEAMALLYGREDGVAPNAFEAALLLLCANDYCFEWSHDGQRHLTAREQFLADTIRCSLLNQRGQVLHDFVRGAVMLEPPPPRSPAWRSPTDWQAFQEHALGMSLDVYVRCAVAPLFLLSVGWGMLDADGVRKSPHFDPELLPRAASAPNAARVMMERITCDRAEAISELQRNLKDGLPVGHAFFYRKPFIKGNDGFVIPASPWVVRAHLQTGLWALHLAEAKRQSPHGAHEWLSAFGDIFENWCRDVARTAYASNAAAQDRLILPVEIGGPDEIADVILVAGRDVALFSMKSSFLPETAVKRGHSRVGVVDWYERLLFHRKGFRLDGQVQRDGALRSLRSTAAKIVRGAYPEIHPASRIYPVLVTYDDIGGDNLGTARWVQARCNQENLLKGTRMRHLTMLDVRGFEHLMALAARGRSIPRLLAEKTSSRWHLETLDVYFHHRKFTVEDVRLPALDERFGEVTKSMLSALSFPADAGA